MHECFALLNCYCHSLLGPSSWHFQPTPTLIPKSHIDYGSSQCEKWTVRPSGKLGTRPSDICSGQNRIVSSMNEIEVLYCHQILGPFIF